MTLGGSVTAPSNLKAEAGAATVNLSWDPPSGKLPDRYDIYRDGEQVASVTGTTYKDAGLMGSTEYQYQIQAVRGTGLSQAAELTVQTKSYFEEIPDSGVYFSDMRFSINGRPVNEIDTGELRIDSQLTSVDYTGTVKTLAVLYQGQEMRQAAVGETQTCLPGRGQQTSLKLDINETDGARVEVFVWDTVGGLRLMTQICTLDDTGFRQSERISGVQNPVTASVKYDPASRQILLSVQTDKAEQGYITVAAVASDANLESLQPGQIAYLGCIPVEEGELTQTSVAVSESVPDGLYDVWLGTDREGIQVKKSFYFADKERLAQALSAVNDVELTVAEAKAALEEPVLCLNLEDYSQIPAVEREIMLGWFLSWREAPMETPEQVQALLDKAVGLMLLQIEKQSGQMDEWIMRYGMQAGMTEEELKTYEGSGAAQRARILSRLTGKMEYQKQDDPAADFLKKYETAYVLAAASDPEISWKRLEELLCNTYRALNLVDPGAVSQAGVSASAVYKAMIGKEYYALQEITDSYQNAINDAKKGSETKPGPTGGGSGGSRGSSGAGQGFTAQSTVDSIPPVVESPPELLFTDLDQAEWAKEYVLQLTNLGIIAQDIHFRPNDQITREEFVKIAIKAFELAEPEAECDFMDVSKDEWYYPYVAAAFHRGIITGINDEEFGTGLSLTRQDAAVILDRLIPHGGETVADEPFSDDSQIAVYAKDAVYHMKEIGILAGRTNDEFCPEDSLTRAEAAKMISVMLQNQKQPLEKAGD